MIGILLTIAVIVGVPLFLIALALSNAIDSAQDPLLVMSYVLAGFLALLVLLMLPKLMKLRKRAKAGKLYSESYLDAAELKSSVTLVFGVVINLGYAVFKLIAAARNHALLYAAEAIYYLVLSGIRLLLASGARIGKQKESRVLGAWKSYRRCGWELLLLDFAMSLVILQSMRWESDTVMLSALVYGSAFWALYRLTAAFVQIIKFRRTERPLISASKYINLSAALMSIFVLQNTMMLHFAKDAALRAQMNTWFGFGVAGAVILIAILMIVHGTKKVRAIKASKALEEQILQEKLS